MNDPKTLLDNIFDNFLKGSQIFKNRDVLRHDYIPENLPHREEQIRHLGEILAPSLKNSLCSNVLVYGKTGTGKTAVIRFVLQKLEQKARELNVPVKICFINCRIVGTEYRILSNLCAGIGLTIPFTGLSVSEVFDRFRFYLDSKSLLLIVALDEIDVVIKNCGDTLLYELTRINSTLNDSKVTILGVSNDLRFKEYLDPRVLSSLSEEEIVFKPYDADELQDILEERGKIAFQDGVLTEGALRLCAALAAAEHGDARRALDLLRVAGELAERSNMPYVSEEHVRQAQKRIEHDRILETVKSLPTHSKIVLLSIYLLNKNRVSRTMTGDIYNLYCELCQELGITSLTQRRVSGLINELDVMGLINSRVISLGRYGRTKKTSLGIPFGAVKEAFYSDERFRPMLNYSPKYLTIT
ncbi:MAG: ORC1-type DNA replication protein [Nitrososphaerota archaeon]|nr:ORC1-type DNA replication protein [Nitrososphaerota archaeon]